MKHHDFEAQIRRDGFSFDETVICVVPGCKFAIDRRHAYALGRHALYIEHEAFQDKQWHEDAGPDLLHA